MFNSLIHALNLLATYKLSSCFFGRTQWSNMFPPSRFADGKFVVMQVRLANHRIGSTIR